MVENTLDIMLSGNEPIVLKLVEEQGIEAAEQFVTKFNNACCQLAALEKDVQYAINQNNKRFLCPVESFSSLSH